MRDSIDHDEAEHVFTKCGHEGRRDDRVTSLVDIGEACHCCTKKYRQRL